MREHNYCDFNYQFIVHMFNAASSFPACMGVVHALLFTLGVGMLLCPNKMQLAT